MPTPHRSSGVAVWLGALLLVGTGCSKSLQADSGAKSFEPGAQLAQASAQQKTAASSNESKLPSPTAPDNQESSISEPPTRIPSTPGSDRSPQNGRKSEQDATGESLVARTDPPNLSRHHVEAMPGEQLATATGDLEDVFFGFDSWHVDHEGKQTLMLDAEWITANPDRKVTIEGHCDERGTLAYNLVLGEKRAKAVETYLVDLGIDSQRLTVVSYGKERLFCTDHEEGCHQRNRRGHFAVRVP